MIRVELTDFYLWLLMFWKSVHFFTWKLDSIQSELLSTSLQVTLMSLAIDGNLSIGFREIFIPS